MEDKILKAIQHIRLKCKKRVTSQNIFSFLNKGASLVDTKLFHEVLNKMETDGYIFKKGKGKNASFFVKSHLIDNNKNVVSNTFPADNNTASLVQQINLVSPETVESLEAFIDRNYNNLPANTPKFAQVKTPTKTRCDHVLKQLNSQRHNEPSTDLFLQDEIIFLREELVNKQNTIDKLLQVFSVDTKIIHRDEQKISHKSCQINLLTKKCNSNDESINIYNELTDCSIDQLNKTKEISTQTEHQLNPIDDELLQNTSCDDVLASKNTKQKNAEAKINLENQLREIRQIKHQNYTNDKNPTKEQFQHYTNNEDPTKVQSTKSSEEKHPVDIVTHKWSKNTTLIVGDSMIAGVNETMISRKGRVVKVRPFSGATIEDMYDYLKPILKKCPDNIILHVGTNNAAREPPRVVFDKLLSLKSFIEKTLPNCKISISNLIKRTDNNEAAKTVDKVNELLFTLQLDIVDNNNITKNELSRKGLHLNDIGYGKLAVNFIRKIKNLKRS